MAGVRAERRRGEDGKWKERAFKRGSRQDRWGRRFKDGVEVLGSMPGKVRVQRRPGEKMAVLFVRVREDDKAALEAWVEELRKEGEVWRYVGVSDLVRDILQATLRAREKKGGV